MGEWNAEKIKTNCLNYSSKIDVVDFPYDPKEYNFDKRNYEDYRNKKKLQLHVIFDLLVEESLIFVNIYYQMQKVIWRKRGIN